MIGTFMNTKSCTFNVQLKNLIEKMRFNLDIDENYFARTEKNVQF